MGSWVDTHCHLQLAREDPEALIERAVDVDWMVVPGVDLASSRAASELSLRHGDRLRHSVGLHPHDASKWEAERDDLESLMAAADAVGETGLDHYRNLAPRPAQRQAFIDQLRLGRQLGKPVIIHCRDAFEDIHDIIDVEGGGPDLVLHCWTGGPRWSRRFAELGVTFSFAGPVAFETGDTVRRGAAVIDPERVMVETDTPYLSPPPHRQEDNEPARVPLVGAALAEVWGMTPERVAELTSARAARVFG